MSTITFQTMMPIDLGEASQEKKVLVGQIADSATSSRPFRREMHFWREMSKDLYHLYQLNKLDFISEGYTGTGHFSICTRPVPICTTYTQGKASSELVKAATYKAKGNSRSQSPFFLAGPLSLIFSSTKVTASDSAEVTVSMTSEASKTSGKCDFGSHLSAPKLASAKYRQQRSPTPEVTVTSRNAINGLAPASLGVYPDNLLNKKAESAFVQATGKEKGPAVSQALLSTSVISCTGESNELHHNWHLQATGNLSYSHDQHPNKTGAGFESLRTKADIDRSKVRFFYVRYLRCAFIMVRRNGGASALAGFFGSSLSTPIRLTSPFESGLVRLQNLTKEATTMATTQTRPEFIDTYWIIPEYETTPYGKVSFTRQDRRTFIAMFKDSRLIWAGRQPVSAPTKYVKRMRSSKECLKDPESEKLPVKDPVTITNIVTVQGVAHV